MIFADLHAHTTASDGSYTPTELVNAAQAFGLTYLAVTDHDTTAGVAEAAAAGRLCGIRLICGVELSAEGPPGKCHLLGLGIDPANIPLNTVLSEISEARRARNVRIAERLRALGVAITLEEVTAAAPPGANVGRPHFAQVLVARGFVPDTKAAFDRYLADDAPGYVSRQTLTPAEAINLIHGAGGVCCIAHPGLLRLAEQETLERRIAALKDIGMDGLEAYYSAHPPVMTERLLRLADKLGMIVTGGSDFHGATKPNVPLGIVMDGAPLPAERLPESLLARAI